MERRGGILTTKLSMPLEHPLGMSTGRVGSSTSRPRLVQSGPRPTTPRCDNASNSPSDLRVLRALRGADPSSSRERAVRSKRRALTETRRHGGAQERDPYRNRGACGPSTSASLTQGWSRQCVKLVDLPSLGEPRMEDGAARTVHDQRPVLLCVSVSSVRVCSGTPASGGGRADSPRPSPW